MLENSERSLRGVRMGKSDRWSARNKPIRFKDLGFRIAEMLHKKIKIVIFCIFPPQLTHTQLTYILGELNNGRLNRQQQGLDGFHRVPCFDLM